jgi:hypothetical protein
MRDEIHEGSGRRLAARRFAIARSCGRPDVCRRRLRRPGRHHVGRFEGVVNLAIRRVPRFRNDSVPDVSEYRISAEKNAAGITRLRAALKANPVTRKALAARGISINRVVGVRISSNGSLLLYLL